MDQILSIMPKNFDEFWKPEAWGQKVLPDRLVLMGQKLKENAKIPELLDVLVDVKITLPFLNESTLSEYTKEMILVKKKTWVNEAENNNGDLSVVSK